MLLDTATQSPEPSPPPRDSTAAPRQAEPQTAEPPESPSPAKTTTPAKTANEVVPTDDTTLPVADCAKPDCKLPVTLIEPTIPPETADDTQNPDAAPATTDAAADAPVDTLLTTLPELPQPAAAPVPVVPQVQSEPQVQAEVLDAPEAAAIQGAAAAAEAPKLDPLKAEAAGAELAGAEVTAAETPKTDVVKTDAPKAVPKSAPIKPGALEIHPLTTDASEAKPQAESQSSADPEVSADQAPAPTVHPRAAKPVAPAPTAEPRAVDAPAAPAPHSSEVAAKLGADATPNLGVAPFVHSTVAASQSQHAALPGAPQPDATVPVAGLAVAIAAQAQAGKSRFEIRLDPPELGRIDIRLDIDRDGNVASRLVVERQDTLDLLRRDASQLERALQQAGLKTADNALEFSLRGHAFGRDDETPDLPNRLVIPEDDAAPPEALRHGYGRILGLGGGIDIRV